MHPATMDNILAKLSHQQSLIEKQKNAVAAAETVMATATQAADHVGQSSSSSQGNHDGAVQRLQKELEAAKALIARQEQEMIQNRNITHTLDQAMGPPSEVDYNMRGDVTEQTIASLQSTLNASTRAIAPRQDGWQVQDDSRSDISDTVSNGFYQNRASAWGAGNGARAGLSNQISPIESQFSDPASVSSGRGYGRQGMPTNPAQRVFSLPPPSGYSSDSSYSEPYLAAYNAQYGQGQAGRRNFPQSNRVGSMYAPRNNGWDQYGSVNTGHPAGQSVGSYQMGVYPNNLAYQPQPIGTPLSATAPEFQASPSNSSGWSGPVS